MVLPLSIDLRLRVAAALEVGETVRAAAHRFGVSVASAVRIGQRQLMGLGQVPGKVGGSRRAVLAGNSGDWLLARLAGKPDLTMRALAADWLGVASMWRMTRSGGLSARRGRRSKKDPDGRRTVPPECGAVPGQVEGTPESA